MKNIFLIFLFTFLGNIFCCEGQIKTTKIRPKIKHIANQIARHNVLTGSAVGYVGTRPKQWDRYEKLKKEATNEELILLIEHKNAVVRCYSFDALAYRKGIDIFPILIKHLSDTAEVATFFGCLIFSTIVREYFVGVVTPEEPNNEFYKDLYKLTKKQKTTIDSILFVNEKK